MSEYIDMVPPLSDRDLANTLEFNDIILPSPIVDIVATIEGEHDFADWHWLVVLEDGQCAYITGALLGIWDASSHCEAFVEPTMALAVGQIPESHRDELIAQLPASTRDTLAKP